MLNVFIHPSAFVSPDAKIGDGTRIWINAQIREFSEIGQNCVISKDTYIDKKVIIGDGCKIQNGVSIYHGVTLQNQVFVGPNVTFTNDIVPRAFNPEWQVVPTLIKEGASIGANATILCGLTLGEYCMVAAGSVVTRDVKPYSLVMGNPARHCYFVDKMGKRSIE